MGDGIENAGRWQENVPRLVPRAWRSPFRRRAEGRRDYAIWRAASCEKILPFPIRAW